MVSGRTRETSAAVRCLNPARTPSTSIPWLTASMVTELMTPLLPGAGPPPTTIATRPRDTESVMVGNASQKTAAGPGGDGTNARGAGASQDRDSGRVFKGP